MCNIPKLVQTLNKNNLDKRKTGLNYKKCTLHAHSTLKYNY